MMLFKHKELSKFFNMSPKRYFSRREIEYSPDKIGFVLHFKSQQHCERFDFPFDSEAIAEVLQEWQEVVIPLGFPRSVKIDRKSISDFKGLKKFLFENPVFGSSNPQVKLVHEFDPAGRHRLVSGDRCGDWSGYRGIAVLDLGGVIYAAIAGNSEVPHNVLPDVFMVVPVKAETKIPV